MTTTTKPTYDELADAFAEYLAFTNNDGAVPCGLDRKGTTLKKKDRKVWEDAIERARAVVDAAGGDY